MMNGVTFGTYHSYRTWGLMLTKPFHVSPPEPELKLVKVPGSNVVLDLTESLAGCVTYGQREVECEFVTVEERSKWDALQSEIMNAIHGKRLKIVADSDPDYYYIGRIVVGKFVPDKKTATLTITAQVEPYKRERHGNGGKL